MKGSKQPDLQSLSVRSCLREFGKYLNSLWGELWSRADATAILVLAPTLQRSLHRAYQNWGSFKVKTLKIITTVRVLQSGTNFHHLPWRPSRPSASLFSSEDRQVPSSVPLGLAKLFKICKQDRHSASQSTRWCRLRGRNALCKAKLLAASSTYPLRYPQSFPCKYSKLRPLDSRFSIRF